MGVGANYGLNKGFLAQGSTAYAFGEVVVPGTVEQSVVRSTVANPVGFKGVCQEDVDTTRLATGRVIIGVAITGLVRCIAGAAIAKDSLVISDTNARVIVQAGAAGTPVLGIAMTAATNAGDQIDVLLTPGATK